ncbi:MAG: EAL domain-containing protein [Pseudomonadota bacterium]|nr:EAL domain-containing protein [Pseudomonadota bacterium]
MSRSAVRFVAPVLVSLSVMLIAAVISLELLSTIRAYVGGEGLYSKGQKDATYYLAQYSVSHSQEDFQRYSTAIAFPLGDRQARLALQRIPVDLQAARDGFLAGGNDPADIPSIILLFRLFGRVGPVRQAIAIWTEGDGYTERICAVASRMRQAPATATAREADAAIRSELNLINRELTPLAARFSSTLGEAARLTRTGLMLGLTLGTLLTGFLCIRVTQARVRERHVEERRLARLTGLYAALSRTSQLILRVSDRGRLFDELCRICVGTSGLSLAAVGLLEGDGIRFIASHGIHQRHLERLVVRAAPGPSDRFEPAAASLRSARVRPFKGVQISTGGMFRASASFPLRCQGEAIGVLCVFSEEEQFFQKDIIDLMEQMAMEASFALASLQREAERRYQATILADQNRILNLVASGADLAMIFTTLAQFLEAQSGGGFCSLVALDQTGSHYSLSIAPSLPDGFGRAMVHAFHEERSGPCAEAIAKRTALVIEDLAGYPLAASLRDVVNEAGLQSVNVWPIIGGKDQMLGALALYNRRNDNPHRLDAHLIGICTDLAGIAIESRWAADRIQHLAHHDDLTGLPNRLLFNHHLPRALARVQRGGGAVGVLFLDLDRFKVINDTLGHAAGDAVLCQVSEHLRECLRAADTLARVGGDEFTVLVEQFETPQDLADIAHKLLAAAARTLTINDQEYHLSGSIGIAIYPKDGADSGSLLKNADIAMYRAKASGRNKYEFYSSDINVHTVERLSLENQLRHAVARREFEVHYQPKIDIQTGRISGAEALVRWRHPQRGMLLPAEFIFVAEEVGLIGSIGRLVLDTVCADAKRWRDQGLIPIRVAVNLSAQQFADSRLLADLDSILRETGCDPYALEFEITESVVMTRPDKALLLLQQIKELGITVAIDDFGTGHSSLAYLKRFPVDSVKIDYTFIRDIAADHNDLAITKAIIALGHSMGLTVVAEGVESATQLAILRSCRCDQFQGFLFSEAVPSKELERMLMAQGRETLQGLHARVLGKR